MPSLAGVEIVAASVTEIYAERDAVVRGVGRADTAAVLVLLEESRDAVVSAGDGPVVGGCRGVVVVEGERQRHQTPTGRTSVTSGM